MGKRVKKGGEKKNDFIVMRQPGIEPGSTAWKAAMLTTIPLTLTVCGGVQKSHKSKHRAGRR